MLEDISIVKFKKYIVPNKSISVKNTQQITQNDVCKFLRNINITTPIVRISKPKFLINSSPMTYEKIIINWKKKKIQKKSGSLLYLLSMKHNQEKKLLYNHVREKNLSPELTLW